MAEIVIKTVEDLQKLKDWKIEKTAKITRNNVPVIQLQLSNLAAKNQVVFELFPTTQFKLNGNIMVCDQMLSFQVLDVPTEDTPLPENSE